MRNSTRPPWRSPVSCGTGRPGPSAGPSTPSTVGRAAPVPTSTCRWPTRSSAGSPAPRARKASPRCSRSALRSGGRRDVGVASLAGARRCAGPRPDPGRAGRSRGGTAAAGLEGPPRRVAPGTVSGRRAGGREPGRTDGLGSPAAGRRLITEAEFRGGATAFLAANAAPRPTVETRWGEGSDRVGLFRESTPEEDRRELAEARAWRARCYDAGFGGLSGPVEYGGRGLPQRFERIWAGLESGYDVPTGANLFLVGLGMVAPTILAHGTEEAKQRYLAALWRGDLVGCQLFSEPGAGSDLAAVSTKAVPDGDGWMVSGQKVWTSGAHYSDLGLLLARTSADPANRHHGLTMFLVDMHGPGIDVRPLRQMTGGTSFNEVFLTDVRIPDGHRLGAADGGWRVALTPLMDEGGASGGR